MAHIVRGCARRHVQRVHVLAAAKDVSASSGTRCARPIRRDGSSACALRLQLFATAQRFCRRAASTSSARNHVVQLASAPHEGFEQQSDSCASLAQVCAAPLLPSIPCPLRQSLQATVVVPFAPSSVVLGKTMARRLRNLRCGLQALRKQNYRVIVFMIARHAPSPCNTPEASCCKVYLCTV